jgi:catechol 2,3-dioxygenase-like lactoylglutathione lyase family enzyme
MRATAMDHVNLRYPEGELETALEFYCEKLGFEAELVGYDEDGEPYVDHPSHFSIRFGDNCLVHMTPESDPTIINRYQDASRTGFDHVSLLFDEPIEEIKARLEAADVEIHREFEPSGATGTAPAVFVLDPFGYMLELKVDPARGS